MAMDLQEANKKIAELEKQLGERTSSSSSSSGISARDFEEQAGKVRDLENKVRLSAEADKRRVGETAVLEVIDADGKRFIYNSKMEGALKKSTVIRRWLDPMIVIANSSDDGSNVSIEGCFEHVKNDLQGFSFGGFEVSGRRRQSSSPYADAAKTASKLFAPPGKQAAAIFRDGKIFNLWFSGTGDLEKITLRQLSTQPLVGYDLTRLLEESELALGYLTGQGVGEIFGTVLEGLYSHSELALYNTPGSNYILDELDLRLRGLLFSARGIVWEANLDTRAYERVRMEGADKWLKSLKALVDGFKPDVKRELCFSSRSPAGKRSNATAIDGEEAAAETKAKKKQIYTVVMK